MDNADGIQPRHGCLVQEFIRFHHGFFQKHTAQIHFGFDRAGTEIAAAVLWRVGAFWGFALLILKQGQIIHLAGDFHNPDLNHHGIVFFIDGENTALVPQVIQHDGGTQF